MEGGGVGGQVRGCARKGPGACLPGAGGAGPAGCCAPPPTLPLPPPLRAEHICRRLTEWAAQFEGAGLAGFFRPCAYLQRAAATGTKVSAGRPAAAKL